MRRVLLVLCVVVSTATGVDAQLPASLPEMARALVAARLDSLTGIPEPPAPLDDVKREMRLVGSHEVPGKRQWERKKVPKVAVFSSMVLPGLGQVYNGRRIKVAVMVGFAGFYGANTWLEQKRAQRALKLRDSYPVGSVDWKYQDLLYEFHKETSRDYAWWSGLVWLLGVLDAFVDAHLYDVRTVDPFVDKSAVTNEKYMGLSVKF